MQVSVPPAITDDAFRALLDAMPQQIFVLRPDFTIEFANRALIEYHGESLAATLFSLNAFARDRTLHHPDDVARVQEQGSYRLPRGLPVELEARLLGGDGNYRWFRMKISPVVDAHGKVVCWYGTRSDIDDLKRSEAHIREYAREVRVVGDFVSQPLFTLDTGGRILDANRAAVEFTGQSGESIRTQEDAWAAIVHPADRGTLRTVLDGLGQGLCADTAIRLRRHDGEYRWTLLRLASLDDDCAQALRWYVIGVDVEELNAREERVQAENRVLREEVDKASMFEEIVGSSPAVRNVHTAIEQVAATASTVLITGETGTGKELVARAIHKRSTRADRPFVGVNCGAIPPTLIASELFGHERGAFTGASHRRIGRFELATGGTLFLDEVGDLPPDVQLALLRVLQERELERVGSSRPIKIDVRVIAATNRNLQAAMDNGTFRSDLYYRLNVFPVEIPPLRERTADIPLLVEYFVDRYARQGHKPIRRVDRKTIALLAAYDWPGNVRELQNVIERAVIVCQSETLTIDPRWLARERNARPQRLLNDELASRERQMIETALADSRGRIAGALGAAARLGVPASTLESKIRSMRIDKHRFKRA